MTSKGGGGKAKKGGSGGEGGRPKKEKPSAGHTSQPAIQATSSLQALLLADSFDEFFRPVTLELPRCLLPVLNVPLMNYTIESLASSGVDEIFVFCCAHAEKIERYIKTLQTNNMFPDVSLKCIVSKHSMSVGDALREMYQLAVLREDFILVYGDLITTSNLKTLHDRHKERRNKDKQAIMTVVLSPLRPSAIRKNATGLTASSSVVGGRGNGTGGASAGTAPAKLNASVGGHVHRPRSLSSLTASASTLLSTVDKESLASSSQDLPAPSALTASQNPSASKAPSKAKSLAFDASDDDDDEKGDNEDFSSKASKLSSLVGKTFGVGGDYSSDDDEEDGCDEEDDDENDEARPTVRGKAKSKSSAAPTSPKKKPRSQFDSLDAYEENDDEDDDEDDNDNDVEDDDADDGAARPDSGDDEEEVEDVSDNENELGNDGASVNNVARLGDSANRRIVALDAETGQLLMYQTEAQMALQQRQRGKESHRKAKAKDKDPILEIDVAVFEQHPRLVFRDDVEDAGIAICSSDVLSQFTDNFDYQTVPRLVRGVVNEEILSCKVFVHVETSRATYTRRVSSLRRYQQVSLDILRRWTYPFVPDNNLTWGCTVSLSQEHPQSHQGKAGSKEAAALPTLVVVPVPTSFSYTRDTKGGSGLYKEKNVLLSRSALVGGGDLTDVESVVGEGTTVGPNSRIVASVIGRNCKIGANVVVRNSFLWDGVAIGDNAEINSSLLCSGASVAAGSKLGMATGGVILSFNVDVPERVAVPALAKLTTVADDPVGLYNDPKHIDWNLWRSMLGSSGSSAENVSGVNAKVRQWAYPPMPHSELVSGWEGSSRALLLSSGSSEPTSAQATPSGTRRVLSVSDDTFLADGANKAERPKSIVAATTTASLQGKGPSLVPGGGSNRRPLQSNTASAPSADPKVPNSLQKSTSKTAVDDFEDGYSDGEQPTEGDGSDDGDYDSFGFDDSKEGVHTTAKASVPIKAPSVIAATHQRVSPGKSGKQQQGSASSSATPSGESPNTLGGDDDDDDSLSDIQKFRKEVVKTVVRRVGEKSKIDDLRVEINSLKFAFNESFVESSSCIFAGLMSTIPSTVTSVRQSVKSVLTNWGSIFRNFLGEVNDQTEFIFCIQQFCEEEGNERFVKAFELTLHTLYDMDVLSEQAILAWAAEVKAGSDDDLKFLELCKNLLQWLQEADEE